MTPILPFVPEMPSKHRRWLALANAAKYRGKNAVFYPLKTRLLKRFAVRVGNDKQVIKLKCYCGDGIWRGIEGTAPSQYWETCRKCDGTGIYSTRKILLSRWQMRTGEVFHCYEGNWPLGRHVDAVETIHGVVKHDPVDEKVGQRAFLRLLIRYEPQEWWNYHIRNWEDWMGCFGRRNRFRMRRMIALITPNREEEVPF